jgi:hypothetical protein
MKIRKKIIILISVLALLAVLFEGCINNVNDKNKKDLSKVEKQKENEERPKGPEAIKDRIISSLNKKYGKEFLPMSLVDNDWQNVTDELTVYPKGGDKNKEAFSAIGKMEDGKYTIYDTYVCQLISGEYEDRVKKIAEEFFPQCKVEVVFEDIVFPNEFGINTKLQDIIDAGVKYSPTPYIEVAPTLGSVEEFDKKVDLFVKKMVDNKLQGGLLIYYLKENNLNVTHNDMNHNTYQKGREIAIKQDFSIKEYNYN